jgi:hypothetical protein
VPQKRRSPKQLDREIAEALRNKPHFATLDAFWDLYEQEILRDVVKHKLMIIRPAFGPSARQLMPEADEPPEVFARRVREAAQTIAEREGFAKINTWGRGFQRLARRLGIPYTQQAIRAAYRARGGTP